MGFKVGYVLAGLVGLWLYADYSTYKDKRDTLKEAVQTRDYTRYQNLKEKIASNRGMADSYSVWLKEYNAMQDSIRLDSVARKAYLEGANMVRDSIKKASKIR